MVRRLNLILVIVPTILLLSPHVAGRVFTSSDGKKVEGDYLVSSDTHVTLKLDRNGKEYTIPLERLSKADQEYVAERRAILEEEEKENGAAKARIAAADAAAEKIAEFAEESIGKQIGDGECWTLADHAFKAAGVKRPGNGSRVWGREVKWEKEKTRPGDILELENTHFAVGGRSAPNHTAVVIECKRKGVVTVCHQNWGGKTVTTKDFDLESITSGGAKIFRYE